LSVSIKTDHYNGPEYCVLVSVNPLSQRDIIGGCFRPGS